MAKEEKLEECFGWELLGYVCRDSDGSIAVVDGTCFHVHSLAAVTPLLPGFLAHLRARGLFADEILVRIVSIVVVLTALVNKYLFPSDSESFYEKTYRELYTEKDRSKSSYFLFLSTYARHK